jgi:hypothetical protein
MIFPKMLIVSLPVNLKTVERPAWHFVQIPTAPGSDRRDISLMSKPGQNAAWEYLPGSPLGRFCHDNRTTPRHHHRTVSNDINGLALPSSLSSRHGLFGFLVFASGPIAIVSSKAKARRRSARRICR